jgi:hypothetical protein
MVCGLDVQASGAASFCAMLSRDSQRLGCEMPKELLYTWPVGKDRVTHKGYAVYTVRGRMDVPADLLGEFESAEAAVASAEKLGAGHHAYRVTTGGTRGTQPRERLSRSDLPINLVLNPTPKA